MAVAQGASLIFVVILVGLMSGPLEAGRRLGRGTEWVARDFRTWVGLGWVALLSLCLLAIGWVKPERLEELSTVAVTASGLGATGLVARRLLRLSDPAAQLFDIFTASLEQLRAVVASDRKQTDQALETAGVEQVVSAQVRSFASPRVQQQIARLVEVFTTTSSVAWRDGQWPLAVRAHQYATELAREYLSLVEAADGSDHVVTTYVNETDDIHEIAGGPDGRKLSQALVMALGQLGREAASRKEFVDDDGQIDVVFPIVYELATMVIPRRLQDQKSSDPAAAIRGLGSIGVASCEAGGFWGALSTNERILEWAAAATNAHVVHVASPAWEESFRVILGICRRLEGAGRSMVFESALRDLEQALRKVESLPRWSIHSAVGPILRSVTDGTQPTLQVLFYALWEVEENHLESLVKFGRHVAFRLIELLRTAPDQSLRNLSGDVGEVMYQWMAAAATRADQEPAGDAVHRQATESIANILGWLRSLIVREGATQEDHDLEDLVHMYLSGWEMLLFLLRDAPDVPDGVAKEYGDFLDALADPVLAEMPEQFRDTLGLMAKWLRKTGLTEEADRADETARRIPSPASSTWGPPPRSRWGMGSDYFTRRGGLIPGVVTKVEQFFRGKSHAE